MYYIKNNQNKSAQTTIPSASQGMAYGMRTFQTMKIIVFFLSRLYIEWKKKNYVILGKIMNKDNINIG